jgi:hypothetical protein
LSLILFLMGQMIYYNRQMKTLLLTLLISSWAIADNCANRPTDLLIIGDSQTGAAWGRSYYGNFLQECLKNSSLFGQSFVVYGRGGTQPIHWLNNPGLDKIDTIVRDPGNNQVNIGHDKLPLCQKRLGEMLKTHQPKKVLAFFGDNVLDQTDKQVSAQFEALVKVIKDQGYASEDCFIMTPTYEMSVITRRNVPLKNLTATLRINQAIKKAVGDKCQIIDGTEVMKNSTYLLPSKLLKRVQSEGMNGCLGAAGNDNIHVCGEAAKDLAQNVCHIFK